MASLARRAFSEWLGTAFLLAAVVGSGIMAAKLAGGNVALALLCNTLPTGAILVVLILIFGPVSGAHFKSAVSVAFALRRELPWSTVAVYIFAQLLGAIAGVWTAHLRFELPLWQLRDLRVAADDIRVFVPHIVGRPLCGRPLHHLCLLVYGFNLLCQPSGDNCALSFRHVRRYRRGRRASFHCGAIRGDAGGCRDWWVAMAAHSPNPRCRCAQ
jgi:Major intrinsic protein